MIDMGYHTKISNVLHIARKDTLFCIFCWKNKGLKMN